MKQEVARVHELITGLGLAAHPERGYYTETYRAALRVLPCTPQAGERSAATAIYFLVTASQPTTFLHRLRSDEIFHLYEGGPLHILQLFADGTWAEPVLGTNITQGERPQVAIPAGTWFGTRLAPDASHCLVGCTVAPGFEFEDFELDDAHDLEHSYPDVATTIRSMSRKGDQA